MPVVDLTVREHEILLLLAEGFSNMEIAVRLHISESTVHNHMKHLIQKLKAKNRTHAVAQAYHYGILISKGSIR